MTTETWRQQSLDVLRRIALYNVHDSVFVELTMCVEVCMSCSVPLQVCDALATPFWTGEVGFIADLEGDGFRPGETADWPTYLAKQREPYAWGGWREMRVIQELLDVRLVLYELDKEVRPGVCAMLPYACSCGRPMNASATDRTVMISINCACQRILTGRQISMCFQLWRSQ